MNRKLAALLAATLVIMLVLLVRAESDTATSYSYKPRGLRAAFEVLEQSSKIAVKRWLFPFVKLKNTQTNALMIVAEPEKFGSETELLSWIEAGNRLLYFDGASDSSLAFLQTIGISRSSANSSWIDHLASVAAKSRTVFCPSALTEICGNVFAISASQRAALVDQRIDIDIIVGSREAVQAARIKHGQGDIWYFSGVEPITNANIDKFQNLELIYQIAADSKQIWFDEFHHGYTAPLAGRQAARMALFKLLLGLLAVFTVIAALSRMVRFGPAAPVVNHDASGSYEFASVLGLLYREHHANGVLENYLKVWRKRLEACSGISCRWSHVDAATEMVQRGMISAADKEQYIAWTTILSDPSKSSDKDCSTAISFLENLLVEKEGGYA